MSVVVYPRLAELLKERNLTVAEAASTTVPNPPGRTPVTVAPAYFEMFIATFPHLLDKGLPYRHWQRETMGTTTARASWVEPDLLALPS